MSDLRKLLDLVDEKSEIDESIELHDSFDIELDENFSIETGVVGFMEDGIILQGDNAIMEMLSEKGTLLEEVDYDEYNDEAGMFKNNQATGGI